MNHTTLSIVIAAAMYAALIGYSVWHMFFAPQSIFKTNTMKNKFDNDRSRYELSCKLEKLEARKAELEAELTTDYNPALLRELHITDHHIMVAEQRISGEWFSHDGEHQVEFVGHNHMRPC